MVVQNNSLSIDDLLRRLHAGDGEALDILLDKYRAFVHLLIRSRLGGQLRARVDSSDLVQETLLRAAQHAEQFHGACEQEWRGWLGQIAEREVIHQLRHHLGADKRAADREQLLDATVAYHAENSRLLQWWAQAQSSPSQVAMRNERALVLSEALTRLSDDYREVLVLRHLEGRSFTDIAQRMGRSAGAVRVLWIRALKKLRADLAQSLTDESSHAQITT